MDEPANKAQFLDMVQSSRAQLDALLTELDVAQLTRPGVCGDWSIKDIIAHITWHERQMVGLLEAHALVGSELWNLPLDQRNAVIFEENKDRSLKDVLDESAQVTGPLLHWIESLSEEDLFDPSRFPHMPLDWQPWKVIAGNTYEHYQDHIPQIQAALAQRGPD